MPETPPSDAIPENGVVVEMPGMSSVHIDEVKGISKMTGLMEVVDGGTNVKYFFEDGIEEFKEMTFSRIRDGSPNDAKFAGLYERCVHNGERIACTVTQQRRSVTVLELQITKATFFDYSIGDLDTKSKDASRQEFKVRGFWTAKYNP